MRKDMFKVIVERPRRRGGWQKNGREANMDLEDLPSRQSMRRKHRDRKELNENLKPLERYFKSQIGRPWDKVFSEVCEHIDVNSTVQQHVRQHIKDLVHLNVGRDEDGKVVDKRHRWDGKFHEIYHGELYVDPTTKILRRYKSDNKRKRWSNPSPEKIVQARFKQMGLIWYNNTLYKIEVSKPKSPKYPEVQNYVKANSTHARHDFRINPAGVRELINGVSFDHIYFRVARKLIESADLARERERLALERKKKEAALQSAS